MGKGKKASSSSTNKTANLLKEVGESQKATENPEFAIVFGLADPLTMFYCPDGKMYAKDVPKSSDFKAQLSMALQEWGLSSNLLEAPIFIPEPTSARTSVNSWINSVPKDAVITRPTILFPLNNENGALTREKLMDLFKKADKRHKEQSETIVVDIKRQEALQTELNTTKILLEECMQEKENLKEKQQYSQTRQITSQDINELFAKLEISAKENVEYRKENAEHLKGIDEFRKVIKKRDEEIVEFLRVIETQRQEVAELHYELVGNSRVVNGIRTRVLLERYRQYLEDKYSARREGESINAWLARVSQMPGVAENERDLISLVESRAGSFYQELSSNHAHAADESDIALIITRTGVNHGRELQQIFLKVYGYDPNTIANAQFDE
jgi:hypothetical protein